jgi:3-methyladenine DNA glycosylase AlkD
MKQLIKDILASLEELADPRRIEFARTSYPTRMKVIGVTNPNLKMVLREVKAQTRDYTVDEKLQLAKSLIQADVFEMQQMAYEYLDANKKVLKSLTKKDIEDLGKNLDNWVSVDYYAALVVGFAWREKLIGIERIKKYFTSDNYWIRRIALVATVSLNQKARGGTGDSEQTLEICKLAVDDHQDMITKALSWALRELAKVDKDPVLDFMNKYRDRLHRRVVREVTSKLETGRKNV